MKKKTVAKKKVAKTTKPETAKRETLLDRLPKNHGEWLQKVIDLTVRAINPQHPDKGMVAQKERLEAELAAWKAANPK